MNRRRRRAFGSQFQGLSTLALVACSEFGIHDEDAVVQDPVIIEEHFTQSPLPKVDILWVVGDTASMEAEQVALSDAVGPFVEALDEVGVAWQVGVIGTDVSTDNAGILHGEPWIITPGTENTISALSQASQVGTDGSAPEAGLGAAKMALSEPIRGDENRGFRRSDAALHVLFVSDGDDDSSSVLGSDPTGAFLDFLNEEEARTGHPATVSAVVGDEEVGCTGAGGSAQPGTTYLDVATATDGATASICDSDLRPITFAIATDAVVWTDVFSLQADPVIESIRVSVNGSRVDSGWTVRMEPPVILFDVPPAPGSDLTIRYEVDES